MTSPAPVSASLTQLPDQRTAVVTGAGGPAGIGRVTARLLAENGWHVALIDINADGLAAVEAELREAGHHKCGRDSDQHRLGVLGDRGVRPDRRRAAPGRRPGQPGRHRLHGHAARVRAGGVRAGDGGERHRLVSDAQGGGGADDPPGRRPDRQHLLDHRLRRRRHLLQGRLRHRQGRRDRDVQRRRARARSSTGSGQRARARTDRHRDHGRPAHRRTQGLDVGRHPAGPGRSAGGDRRHRRFLLSDGGGYINGATIQIDGGKHMH